MENTKMFEVQNLIDWKTAKNYYIKAKHDIYYDIDNYSRMLAFEICDSGLSSQLDELFGGDWRLVGAADIIMLEKHYEALNRIESLSDLLLKSDVKLEYDIDDAINRIDLLFNSIPDVNTQPDLVLTSFPEHLRMFLSEFSDLLNAKNQAYGNSALEPINIFSKASSSDVILQQIDHKLSRLKNSGIPNKNDVIDLMGYLTLYCLDQNWVSLKDLH